MEKIKTRTGTVIKHTGSHYMVSDLPQWDIYNCVLKGRLRLKGVKSTNPIAVGDRVIYETDDFGTGVIKEILPRKNYIIRKSTNLSRQSHIIAANIDTAFLIVTLDYPQTKPEFIDRFLVTCEAYKIPATIVLNKIDLLDETYTDFLDSFRDIYSNQAGYQIIETSVKENHNIDKIQQACIDKIVLFSGVSGVGKSSLINSLDNTLRLKTAEISDYHKQGRHTTTFYEIHPISTGGFIVDSPGIRGFGLIDMQKEELSHYFPEMVKFIDNCRFKPCTHTHEPGCAVKEAVENSEISAERYISYLSMLEEEEKYR